MPVSFFPPPGSSSVSVNGGRPPSPRRFRILALLALLFCLGAAAGRADLIILKDGFLLHGKIKRDTEAYRDPYHGVVFMAKLDGFYMVDDRARKIIFSANQVIDATRQDALQDVEPIRMDRLRGRTRMPTYWQYQEIGDFDKHLERTVRIRTADGRRLKLYQRITEINPHYLRLEALEGYDWTAYYLTREFSPETLRFLITTHLESLKDRKKLKITDLDIGFYLFRFMCQAGWLGEAEKQLELLERQFPDEKKRVATNREILRKLQGIELADRIERAAHAGQHRKVQALLERFRRDKIDADMIGDRKLTAVLAIQKKEADAVKNVERARRFLTDLPRRVTTFGYRPAYNEAAKLVLENLSADTVGRIDGFVGLALQDERDRKNGRPASYTPDQLMALAVSGWLMGNDAAEAQPDWAMRLWQARKFLLEYLKTEDATDRRNQRLSFEVKKLLPLDEVAQMIRFLPPVPPEDPEKGEKEKTPATVTPKSGVQEIKVNPEGKGPTYFVQLPPEYQPYRAYPVLVVLPDSEGGPRAMLERWSELAAQYGYILAAPAWSNGTVYEYSPAEHAVVLATLRDLRRRFQVDSDRVFLFGYGEGGKMAYDVGLSHPDLFAGVIPMAAQPRWHSLHYWTNAQYVPFYVIDGTHDGTDPKNNRLQFRHWVNRGYPSIYVEYLGRGPEWYGGELPTIFDWMSNKRRVHPMPVLGHDDFATMRETDNRFYWLGTDEISAGCLNEAGARWKSTRRAALISASVGASNTIYVHTFGVKEFTIWFPPALVNYDQKVTVRVNGYPAWTNKEVPKSLEVLLEDFYQRGDRFDLVLAMKKFVVR